MSFAARLAASATAAIPFATKEDLCLAVDYILAHLPAADRPSSPPERDYLSLAELCRHHSISYPHAKLVVAKLAADHPHHIIQCSPNKYVYRADSFAAALRAVPYRSRLNKKNTNTH